MTSKLNCHSLSLVLRTFLGYPLDWFSLQVAMSVCLVITSPAQPTKRPWPYPQNRPLDRFSLKVAMSVCVFAALTTTHKVCYTFSKLLGIRYCTSYFGVSHHPSLRHMKCIITFSKVLGIRYCFTYCSVSHHPSLRRMNNVIPSVIY